jgi:Zn-finger nucleic acid-binding protein
MNCGAPARLDADRCVFVCAHCGSERELPAGVEHLEILGKSAESCPLCDVPLWESRLEALPLHACTRCFGLLVPMTHFAALVDALRVYEGRSYRTPLPRTQDPGHRQLACPRCRQPMMNHLYGGPGNVVIDTCEDCLVNWLDPGELRRIVLAPTTRRPHVAADLPDPNEE